MGFNQKKGDKRGNSSFIFDDISLISFTGTIHRHIYNSPLADARFEYKLHDVAGLIPDVACPISCVRQTDLRTFCILSRQTSTFRQLTYPYRSVTYPICGVRTCRKFRLVDSSALSCRRSVSISSVSVSRGFGTGRTVPPPHRMPVVVRDTSDVSDAILAIMRILSVAG